MIRLNRRDFVRTINAYPSDEYSDDDYFAAVDAGRSPHRKANAEAIFRFLNKWRCRIANRKGRAFHRMMINRQSALQSTRRLVLLNAKLIRHHERITALYDDLHGALGSHTGTAKALHVISPDFFPITDKNIRVGMGCADNAEGYFNFMLRQQPLLQQMLQWNASGTLRFKDGRDKTMLKRIDEYLWVKFNRT